MTLENVQNEIEATRKHFAGREIHGAYFISFDDPEWQKYWQRLKEALLSSTTIKLIARELTERAANQVEKEITARIQASSEFRKVIASLDDWERQFTRKPNEAFSNTAFLVRLDALEQDIHRVNEIDSVIKLVESQTMMLLQAVMMQANQQEK